jgi:accessory gene regulator B
MAITRNEGMLMELMDNIARKIAISIQKNNPKSSSLAVLEYALISLINLILIMGSVLFIALITGRFVDAIVAVLAFPLLRYFSGGLHLKSANICNVISAALILISIYISITYWYTGIILNIIAMILLLLYAPSDIKKSKMKKNQYPLLKIIAILIVASNLLFQSPILSFVFFLQSITTIPVFIHILDRTDW